MPGAQLQKNPTPLQVVAAALINPAGRVLLQQRPAHKHHGGLWEFPGGKIEPGERTSSALVRELAEELGLDVFETALRCAARAVDAKGALSITLFTCRDWHGAPRCLDAQALDWFDLTDLAGLPMPPLDIALAATLAPQLAACQV